MAIALITAFSSKVRPVSWISGRSCSLVRSRSVKFGPSNCANSRVLCWLRVARSKSIAPKFAVIPGGVEGSRCESVKVTSSGSLGPSRTGVFARDDNNLTCHERAPQTISIRSVRIQMAAPLGRAAVVSCAQSWRERFRSGETEILHPRHVPISERRWFARGTSRRLYRDRHYRALQTDARVQRAASNGLGCIRFAGGAIRHQNGAASGDHHAREHRQVQDTAKAHRFLLRLVARNQHSRFEILSLDAVGFSPDLQFLVQPRDEKGRADFDLSRRRSG